jgi:hypothetical protein
MRMPGESKHLADQNCMVACVVNRFSLALEDGQRIAECGRTKLSVSQSNTFQTVTAPRGKPR